jgi:iron complex transport system ATP-binding protein
MKQADEEARRAPGRDVVREAHAATQDAAIALSDIRFRYAAEEDGEDLLQGLTASVTAGSVTALLGPNGVGKTTLLNVILGWLRPHHGTISLFGRELRSLSRRETGRTLSLLPQEEHVPFEYSALEYVLLGRTPYLPPLSAPTDDDRRIAGEALERVGMAGIAGEAITEISGGERQLVMLARSLAQQPRILLMDEPTSHLDLANKRRLADMVRSLAAEGTTVLFTTHDPEFAAVCADDLLLVAAGKLLAHGPVREVMTATLLTRVFGVDVTVAEVAGRPVVFW